MKIFIRRCAGLLAILAVWFGMATAVQIPTTANGTWSNTSPYTKTTPSGVQVRVTLSGATAVGLLNNTALMAQNNTTVPLLPAATNGFQAITTVDSCQTSAPTSLTCSGLGTVTISFTNSAGTPIPVRNPVVHFSRFGGSATGTQNVYFAATYTLTTAGVTLGAPAAGAQNLSVAGNLIRPTTVSTAVTGACSTTAGANTAACGSVPVSGITSQLAFNIGAERHSTAATAPWNANGGGNADGVFFTVSFDEDFGDAPATFDPTAAASHLLSDLTLGSTIDAQNPTTFNGGADGATSVTPSPTVVAAGGDNTGTSGDGADEDAITTFPVLPITATTYSLTVPISGASAAGQVCGWVDFDRSNVFGNVASERACTAFASGATSVVLNWTGLTGLTTGTNYVRLRASYDTTGVQSPTGRLNSGEVEDYRLTITPAADLAISKTGTSTVVEGDTATYTLKVWNQGPSAATGATITDTVPSNLSNVTWSCTASGTAACGTASGSGNAISFASGALPVNTITGAAGATNAAPTTGDYLTITVTGQSSSTGSFTNTANIAAPAGTTDTYTTNNAGSQTTNVTPPFVTTTPNVCSTLSGNTGLGSNLVTDFNNGTFGVSTSDPTVASTGTKSPAAWPYTAANLPNYTYIQASSTSPNDGFVSLVNRMGSPRIFNVWTSTLTPITVSSSVASDDSATGRFLLVNGANPGLSVLETTIGGLSPNTNYQLTGLFANVIDNGTTGHILPDVTLYINGNTFFKTGNIPQDMAAKWRTSGFVFNSGTSTSLTFKLVNNVVSGNGNDFAFDQLNLNHCQGNWTNTLSGYLYADLNTSSTFQNPAEPQLPAGVVVDLRYTDANGNPVTVAKTTTGVGADTGKYVFTNVPPPPTGFTYYVHVEDGSLAGEPSTVPAGYTLATPNNAAIPGTPNYTSGTNTGPDFGFSSTLPRLTITKVSQGGVGAFSFAGTNGVLSQTLTTTTAGTGVTGLTRLLTATSTVTTITETPAAGFVLASATCTGLGSGGTATLSGNTLTLDAAATAASSNITCTFTNHRSPVITLQKALSVARLSSTDQFTLNIGAVNVTTTGTGTSVTSAAATLNPAVAGTTYTISETAAGTTVLGNYTTTYACTNTLAGGQTPSGTGTSFTLTPAPGDNLSCTFTNGRIVDVSIAKAGPASAVAGTTVTYTLTLNNAGPNPADGVTFADDLPNVLTGATATCQNATGGVSGCTASINGSGDLSGSVTTFPSGGSVQIVITASIPAGATASLSNTATATVPAGVVDSNTANNTSSTVTTTLTRTTDLSITKTDGVTTFRAGVTLTYTVVVSNAGPSNASAVTVSDPLPSGIPAGSMTYSAAVSGGATTSVSGTQTGALSDTVAVPVGGTVTYTVTVVVPMTYTGTTVVNTATVTAPGGTTDPGTGNNTATDTDTRETPTANPDTTGTNPLTPVTFNVTGNDTGPADPATVDLDPATAGQQTTFTDPGKGSYTVDASGNVTFTPAPGFVLGSSTISYTVKDLAGLTSTAATITVSVPAAADLSIGKAGPAFARPGDAITYTITVTNTTAAAAAAYTVTDTLATGLAFVSASNGGTYDGGTRTVTWPLISLAGSAQQLLTLDVTAPTDPQVRSGTTTVQNTATATLTGDPNPANNTSAAVTTRMILTQLTKLVRNTSEPSSVFGTSGGGKPGQVLEYCLEARNLGGADLGTVANGYRVRDTLPTNVDALLTAYDADEPSVDTGYGVRITRGTAPATYLKSDTATLSATTLDVNLGILAAGETVTACFQATIR
ncbi:GEVED domain-containing protein [uncultured Deinococcus sp.]|uniref:beta strand repeat-containing protein n=1 Tax=uncultured Deinococcus sp. TaxID=158789 RepID=UPI0025F86407|nr:GEVED domain-containing protein [uncultured Deinococcus sp.]